MALYYKMRQILLQNATAILLQNATEVYYKMRQVFYYKMRQFYYKMRQLLQIAMILLQNATVFTKCDIYYKLPQYKVLLTFLNTTFFIISCKFHSNSVRSSKTAGQFLVWKP